MTRYLVLDIEAVVDSSLWSPPEDNPELFAPVFAWRPIVVGLVLLKDTPAGVEVERIGAIGEPGEPDEASLLARFHDVAVRLGRTTIVTWNGRGFDLPVLMLRSLRYGIRAPWYYGPHRTRYNDPVHCDLMDQMSDCGALREKLPLDGMAKLVGLPGKPAGADQVSGKNVAQAYAAGRMPEITRYCIADAVQTAFLWLRWQVLRGVPGEPGWYRTSARRLLDACDHDERLGGLVASVDRRVLLLEEDAEVAA